MNDTRLNLWMPILWGAAVAVLLRFVPPCCCCGCFNALFAGAVAGGILARQAIKSRQFPDASQGLLVGISAGLACGAVGLVLQLINSAALSPESAQQLLGSIPQSAFKDLLRRSLEMETNAAPLWRAIKVLFVEIGGGAILGAIGGVVTMLIMRQPPSSAAAPPPVPPWSEPTQPWSPPPVPQAIDSTPSDTPPAPGQPPRPE